MKTQWLLPHYQNTEHRTGSCTAATQTLLCQKKTQLESEDNDVWLPTGVLSQCNTNNYKLVISTQARNIYQFTKLVVSGNVSSAIQASTAFSWIRFASFSPNGSRVPSTWRTECENKVRETQEDFIHWNSTDSATNLYPNRFKYGTIENEVSCKKKI